MSELTLHRIPFTREADSRLRMLKARTGITPNILCRIAFCLSLEEPSIPAEITEPFTPGREINRYTLLGRYDQAFVAMLVARLSMDNLNLYKIDKMFLAHIDRGIEILTSRVKSVSGMAHFF